MLSPETVLCADGVEVADVACRHPKGRGRHTEEASGRILVFVRRGCFVRSVDGVASLLDPTLAYCTNPGEEQRYDHPQVGGDDCTSLRLDDGRLASLWGGEPELPSAPIPVSARLDFEHRLLLAAARRGAERHTLVEGAISLAARALRASDVRTVDAGRPATARARRALVDGAREALAADPDRSLPQLARELAASPHHLSRVFRARTGETISGHRMQLRSRAALERLAGGERDLARLAAESGFADQSHLCRVLRAQTGSTPAALRRVLGDGPSR